LTLQQDVTEAVLYILQVPEEEIMVELEVDYTGTKHIPIYVMLPVSDCRCMILSYP